MSNEFRDNFIFCIIQFNPKNQYFLCLTSQEPKIKIIVDDPASYIVH